LDAHADRDDRRLVALLHGAVIRGLAADRIEVAPVDVAERGDRLPDAAPRSDVDRILGLAKADDERRRARFAGDHRVEITIEQRAKTPAVTVGLREGRARSEREHGA